MAKKVQMREIAVDTGVDEIKINGKHVLRVNLADINLAARFEQMVGEITPLTQELDKAEDSSERVKAAYVADQKIKEKLGEVFPLGNDFEVIFDGVNVMSPTNSGATVLENFIEAITPLIEEYAGQRMASMNERAKAAAAKAAANREQRRAAEKQA